MNPSVLIRWAGRAMPRWSCVLWHEADAAASTTDDVRAIRALLARATPLPY